MAPGYPIRVNGIYIFTVEALYQACRFPHRPDVQRLIIGQHSPMTAKMKSKPFRNDSRPDWNQVRVKVMRWCLHVKLAQHWNKFSQLLLTTGNRFIVEDSHKDYFWGAKAIDSSTLVGKNVLGRLLMELREEIKQGQELRLVEPPRIPNFLLFGKPITAVDFRTEKTLPIVIEHKPALPKQPIRQASLPLFDLTASFPDQGYINTIKAQEYAVPEQVRIEKLRPYPSVKDSGVPWLGTVPDHWQVLPNRALFNEVKERDCPREQMLSVTIKKGVIPQHSLLADSSKKDSSNLDKSSYKLVRRGDIAYNKMRAWQGAIGVSDYQGIISPAYVVQRPRDGINPKYFHYLMRTPGFAKEAERWSYGITSDMWSLRPEHFKLIYSCLPPLPEQAAIVKYLDYMDRRIRKYIRAKQKLIKLLEEQKQIIIHEAVSRGLDPNVRLKPSGMDWLGDVPEHWKVIPIKRAFISMTYGISESTVNEGTIRLLTMAHIQNGNIRVPLSGGVKSVDPNLLLQKNDLIFNRTNSAELVGKVGLFDGSEEAVTFASYLVRMRPKPEYAPEFLNLLLNDCYVLSIARREAVPSLHQSNLNPTRYGRLHIALPELPEQKEIVCFVNRATTNLNKAINHYNYEITLLQEYYNRLFSDVVTGKLDVCEVTVKLPKETEKEIDLIEIDDSTSDDEIDENITEEIDE